MGDFGYVSRKIGGAIDKILCANFHKFERPLPAGKYVSVCFDDFPRSAALTAAPMLERRGWHATWYVTGGFMDSYTPEYGEMFTAEDLTLLSQNGHDIGCHTFDHIDFAQASESEIATQCARNREFLRNFGIETPRSFAFPFGAANLRSKQFMAGTGMIMRGVKPGLQNDRVDLGMLKAQGLQANQGGTARAHDLIDELARRDGWLVIFTHDVRPDPSEWGVTPEDFEAVLDHISKIGAEVVTIGDMADRLRQNTVAQDTLVPA